MREDVDDRAKRLLRELKLLNIEEEEERKIYKRCELYAYVFAIEGGLPSREIYIAIDIKALPDPTNKESSSKFIISKGTDNYYEILQIISEKYQVNTEVITIIKPIEIRPRDNPPKWWMIRDEYDINYRKRKPTKSKIVRKTPKKVIKKCKCKR